MNIIQFPSSRVIEINQYILDTGKGLDSNPQGNQSSVHNGKVVAVHHAHFFQLSLFPTPQQGYKNQAQINNDSPSRESVY